MMRILQPSLIREEGVPRALVCKRAYFVLSRERLERCELASEVDDDGIGERGDEERVLRGVLVEREEEGWGVRCVVREERAGGRQCLAYGGRRVRDLHSEAIAREVRGEPPLQLRLGHASPPQKGELA